MLAQMVSRGLFVLSDVLLGLDIFFDVFLWQCEWIWACCGCGQMLIVFGWPHSEGARVEVSLNYI